MAENYTPRVKAILREHGCTFVRQGKGDHEIWQSPINNRRFMVDNKIKSSPSGPIYVEEGGYCEGVLTTRDAQPSNAHPAFCALRTSGGTASAANSAIASSSFITFWSCTPSRRIETVPVSASFLPTTSRSGTLASECSRTL
jgi:hypothetical protein